MKSEHELLSQMKTFIQAREWDKDDLNNVYNFLLNLTEETGEVWNLIKWTKTDEEFKSILAQKKADFEDGIGDMLWLIFRLAIICKVDPYESLKNVFAEYEGRFPVDQVKGKHGNRLLGGFDSKYDS